MIKTRNSNKFSKFSCLSIINGLPLRILTLANRRKFSRTPGTFTFYSSEQKYSHVSSIIDFEWCITREFQNVNFLKFVH